MVAKVDSAFVLGSFSLLLSLLILSHPVLGATLTVCPTGCDHSGVQQALDAAAPGDTIDVAEGAYFETEITFPSQVTLVGGWRSDFLEWDPATYVTTIDGGGGNVLVIANAQSVRVEGLTVTGGARGVLVLESSDVVLSANEITGNAGDHNGGGLYARKASLRLLDNYVHANQAIHGGGLYVDGVGSYLLEISGNVVAANHATVSGGGLYLTNLVAASSVRGNRVLANTALANGGGGYLLQPRDYEWRDNTLLGNQAGKDGGGLFINDPNRQRFVNTLVAGNTAAGRGGGVYVRTGDRADFLHTTVADNTAGSGEGDGIYYYLSNSGRLANTIFSQGGGDDLYLLGGAVHLEVAFCDVEDGDFAGANGNVAVDPLFVDRSHPDPALRDYRLAPGSLLIDAGTTFSEIPADLAGLPRPQGNYADPGAYEYVFPPGEEPPEIVVATLGGTPYTARQGGAQAALDAARPGDVVEMADGVHYGQVQLPSGVTLRGSGAGTVTLSGLGRYGAVVSGFQAADVRVEGLRLEGSVLENVISLRYVQGAWLEGLQVTGGARGVYVANSSDVVLYANEITGNAGDHDGGGLYARGSSLRLLDNYVHANQALNGGGLYLDNYENSLLEIGGNEVVANHANVNGGGLYLRDNRDVAASVHGNRILANTSRYDGGGVYLYMPQDDEWRNNTLLGNQAGRSGGGLFANLPDRQRFVNTLVAGNSAATRGGGLCFYASTFTDILHATVADNTAGSGEGDGIYFLGANSGRLVNTILSHGDGDDLYQSASNALEVAFCDIEDGDYAGANGNVAVDPLFVDRSHPDPVLRDYHLSSPSLLIDAGTNDGPPDEDFDGAPRPFDADGDGLAVADIGADEYTRLQALDVAITPNPAVLGALVCFEGHGVPGNGLQITGYRWRSDLDGDLGTESSFCTTALSLGDHTISFKVQDETGAFSDEIAASLAVLDASTGSDLAVAASDIAFFDADGVPITNPDPGEPLRIRAEIHNAGFTASGSQVVVHFYLDTQATPFGTATLAAIEAGTSATAEVLTSAPAAEGPHVVRVVAESDDYESLLDNNVGTQLLLVGSGDAQIEVTVAFSSATLAPGRPFDVFGLAEYVSDSGWRLPVLGAAVSVRVEAKTYSTFTVTGGRYARHVPQAPDVPAAYVAHVTVDDSTLVGTASAVFTVAACELDLAVFPHEVSPGAATLGVGKPTRAFLRNLGYQVVTGPVDALYEILDPSGTTVYSQSLQLAGMAGSSGVLQDFGPWTPAVEGIHTLRVSVGAAAGECTTGNNVAVREIPVYPAIADLTPFSLEAPDPTLCSATDAVSLRARIENVGGLTSAATQVRFTADGADLAASPVPLDALAGEGSQAIVDVDWFPANPGTYQVCATVDDPVGGNNSLCRTITLRGGTSGGDLELRDLTCPVVYAGFATPFTAHVGNAGCAASSSGAPVIFEASGNEFGRVALPALAPGARTTATAGAIFPVPGDRVVCAIAADPADAHAANDRRCETVTVHPALPDLRIYSSDIAFSDTAPRPGDEITITASVHNAGLIAAEEIRVRFLENATLPIASDQLLTTPIPPGGTATASVQWTAPAAGTFVIQVEVSPVVPAADPNFDDNAATRAILVLPGDSDGDGVLDEDDRCPYEPPAGGLDADGDGCTDTVDDLITIVEEMPIPVDAKDGLLDKLHEALTSLENGNPGPAVEGQLGAFIHQVEGLRGNAISEDDADLLIAYADNLIALLSQGDG